MDIAYDINILVHFSTVGTLINFIHSYITPKGELNKDFEV